MSFTYRMPDGAEIVCDTLEELHEIIRAFREAQPTSERKPPANAMIRAALPRQQSKVRKVADYTYLKMAWRIVRSLLAEKSEVGKLSVTLYKEHHIGASTGRIILQRLEQEKPSFLRVISFHRGKSPYVRLTDRVLAESFANTQERLYREKLEAEGLELGKAEP